MLAWPLSGREAEVELIHGMMGDDAVSGVVLYGDAGVGKTRLARDALASAGGLGAKTLWAVGTATAAAVPLGAVAHLVPLGPAGETSSPFALLRQAIDRLVADAAGRPLVVGVDDAHLLDHLSATLVHQLASTGAARLVLTVRKGSPVPDAFMSLWKDDVLGRIEVRALDRQQTGELLEAGLEGPVESVTVARLWEVTEGNPLFLRHLVEGEVDAGRLRQESSVWRWRGTMAVGSALAELIVAGLVDVGPEVREVLELLAFGEPLGVALLEELAGTAGLETAERRGMVTVERSEGRLEARLAHPLYGEVLRTQVPTRRADQVRAHLAAAIGSDTDREPDLLKVAVLHLESTADADIGLLTRAASMAFALLDIGLAERLARAAVAAGAGFEARLNVAYATTWQGRSEEAIAELESLAEAAETDEQRAQVTIPWVGTLFWSMGQPQRAEAVLRGAEGAVDPAGAAGLHLRSLRSAIAYNLGRCEVALTMAEEVLSSPQASAEARAWAAAAAVCSLARTGFPDRAAEIARIGMTAVQEAPHASIVLDALTWGDIMGDLLAGMLDRAEEKAARCQARFLEQVQGSATPGRMGIDTPQLLPAALSIGSAALHRGQLDLALRWFQEVTAVTGSDPAAWRWLAHSYATQTLGMRGDAVAASQSQKEMMAARHPSMLANEADALLAQAWAAAAEGVLSQACGHARAAAELATVQGMNASAIHAWHTLVRMGGPADADCAASPLRRLAALVEGPFAPAAADHAQAAADRDGGALDQVAATFEAMGADVLAADAYAHAATAHDHAARRASANASGSRARALGERCHARTPALDAAQLPLPISDREREVAILAARGMSNRQIAERLIVSVRTVESHLYQASAKLGVTGREALIKVLAPLD